MDIYLVGGAVRDRLLGRPVTERDYVVVGASPEQMLQLGYRRVGKDFPVFLHPHSAEEYALARTERQSARADGEPVVHADPAVTLKDDLSRRDLTINALAEDSQGRLIDYFGGLQDLRQRRLRHVSAAFAEDPLRILRAARFAARYADLGFTLADETLRLMRAMARAGALDALVPERVWQELLKVFSEQRPDVFFETLRDCGALQPIFPELARLWGVPQPPQWHPEIDTGVHAMMVLRMARRLSDDPAVVFAALTHDLGKGITPAHILPSHRGHEERSAQLTQALCERLKAPARFRQIALLVARQHGHIHRAAELRAATVLRVLTAADAFRRPGRLEAMLLAAEADYRGRQGFEERPYPQADYFRAWRQAAATVDSARVAANCRRPELIAEAIAQARIAAIKQVDIAKLGDGFSVGNGRNKS
jgi:tRNA nucleotidyltransferase (CCA-adding enzyme)